LASGSAGIVAAVLEEPQAVIIRQSTRSTAIRDAFFFIWYPPSLFKTGFSEILFLLFGAAGFIRNHHASSQ
jgi:hypothetical protein